MIMIPHRKANAPFFSSQTLLGSCMKPFATNALGKKVTRAGREYLQHAASLKVHFFEVTSLIKNGLKKRFEHQSETERDDQDNQGIITSVYNWFMAVPEDNEIGGTNTQSLNDFVLTDKKFLKALQRELKLFEVCIRIFEQECIESIIETQKEV